ncbi:aldehyde ferredoxin oxidoreductase C-terminal domain-containing protein [Halorientalis marina]|uniref:aldehyde ferredoxin oxidoreductase C-terminal domain-containing protein n=1 Tax=Halorientalis marina TaxID=2931976 RepID=UPI001FF13785|nr:aldehyde ferredoxin oxidoreductase C-terminal domain-containing protein [Halorientalis marina]
MNHVRGSLLSIDVGEQAAATVAIDDERSSFIGGRGLGTRLAHERIPFDADPFGPENRLVFTTGPLQTSTMSFTGRMNCTGLSPLTDGLLSSNAGGYLSRNFADTGYAAVEITGVSDDLLAVHVRDEGVSFEPVPELADAEVSRVSAYVENEHHLGEDAVACVGPAGERQVRFASIMTTEHRTFGRGGLGAVLGAKNVKLLTVAGDSRRPVDVPDVTADVHREAATSDHIMKRQGTTSVTELANELDALPTRYFSEQSFEGAASIGGDAVESKKYEKGTCSQCAFACKLPTRDEESGVETEGPEYETVMAFGANAGIDDVVDVMVSNDLCDELGLDTISCGDVVSAYLAAEGEFGNAELAHDLVEKIAYREAEGDLLAEGIDRVHDELGVENWTMKGMEFSAHDGRALNGQGLAFATSNRGADHLYGSMYEQEYPLVDESEALDPEGVEGKAAPLVASENHNAVRDSGIVCRFSRGFVTDERLERLLDASLDRLLEIGARVIDMERHFANQRGRDRRADEALPYEISGLADELDAYYERRGWNADGTVPAERVP